MQRLALGTAQFGLDYGVANRRGQVSLAQIREILFAAGQAGIETLDTAIAYGSSEEQLGQVGVNHWRIVSKLPGLPAADVSIPQWTEVMINGSLQRLGLEKLFALLLHRPGDLLTPRGPVLYQSLLDLRQRGLVAKIGISAYGPDELADICRHYDIDLVQMPFNPFDRRLTQSGLLRRLREKGIQIHIRSIFLQGLLLMAPASRPAYFNRWQGLWNRWHDWLIRQDIDALSACLRFALAEQGIDRVIVGIDSLAQFKEILAAAEGPLPAIPDEICSTDLDLVNPSQWQLA